MRVLVVGGYGLVGGWVSRHLRAAGHDLELIIAGRRPEVGKVLAGELDARVVRLDVVEAEAGLAEVGQVDLVVSVVQDPGDNLMMAALRAGAAHINIVRRADNLGPSAMAATLLAQLPALAMGHWQAGVTTFAALGLAQAFQSVERVEMAGMFDPADPIGEMTTSDSGTFFTQALMRRDHQWLWVDPSAHLRDVDRGELPSFKAQPMGVLDVSGVATMTGARNVRFDLGLGSSIGTVAGRQASHEIYVDMWGKDLQGAASVKRMVVTDPLGQAHLTALGVLVGVERLLGLDGEAAPTGGLVFPEGLIDPQRALARLRDFGVVMETVSLEAV